MPDELPPVPKRRSDPEMQNLIYKGGKPGPRRRPNPRLENPIYEKVSANDENAILRAQNDELAREAIGMKAAWMEVQAENERLRAEREDYKTALLAIVNQDPAWAEYVNLVLSGELAKHERA